jgi:DsbC/DsbD-like thiol-disulfide interchange protein
LGSNALTGNTQTKMLKIKSERLLRANMQRKIFALSTCCLLIVSAACTHNAPTTTTNTKATATPAGKPTPAQIVRASADALTIKAGSATDASVHLQIADGYHVNANPASFSYLRATELEVVPTASLTAGKPAYPAPVLKKFQFAPQPIAVYEHEAVIKLPVRAAASGPQGPTSLRAQVHVQACDEETCFPPTTIKLDIPVTIN